VIAHPDVRGGARTEALASAVDIAPTLLEIAGLEGGERASRHPALKGHSLMPVLHGQAVRQGILNAVESITTLDASFWFEFADPEAPKRVAAGDLRPDWEKRGFLRARSDARYTFGRYFSPLRPNRPADTRRCWPTTTWSCTTASRTRPRCATWPRTPPTAIWWSVTGCCWRA
jgi:arylsulfatase